MAYPSADLRRVLAFLLAMGPYLRSNSYGKFQVRPDIAFRDRDPR